MKSVCFWTSDRSKLSHLSHLGWLSIPRQLGVLAFTILCFTVPAQSSQNFSVQIGDREGTQSSDDWDEFWGSIPASARGRLR